MNIIERLQWRYATKKFDDTQIITETKIEVLKHAFNLTATSYGLQPVKLLLIKDKVLQHELVSHSMNQQQVGQASHVLVFCIVDTVDEAYVEAYFNRIQRIRNTPEEILNGFKNYLIDDFKSKAQVEIDTWATKQAYLTMGNLLTICALEAIDACPMEGFDPKAYDEKLGLAEKGLKSVLVMPIGYRAEDDMFSSLKKVRKTIKDSVIELET
ncbi:MAG: NAD(P)H-dependent oxidoreductase [Flavobacteriaceae bacterium]|nr:NAD(P)H-dependent oxidoreductase [Flavobacteriaceae bacterium]